MGELSTGTLISVCILGAGIVYLLVSLCVSLMIAKKHGIILVKPNFDKHWYIMLSIVILGAFNFVLALGSTSHRYSDLLNDFKTGGIEAYADYIGTKNLKFDTAEEEQAFFNEKIAEYEEEARKERQKNTDDCLVRGIAFAAYLCILLSESTFVTKSGLLYFCHFKPREFKAKIEDDEICLYIAKIKAPQLRLRTAEKNLRLLSEYIVEEVTNKPKPEGIFDYQEPV